MLRFYIALLSIQSTFSEIWGARLEIILSRNITQAQPRDLDYTDPTGKENIRQTEQTPQQATSMDTLTPWKFHYPPLANNYIRQSNQAYPSRSLYFSPLLSNASSNRCITPSTFSSSSLRPITCTPTGSPAIFTAS